MRSTDQDQFLEIVLGLAELTGKKLSPVGLEMYWRALQHWDIEAVRASASYLARTCEFMPVPFDFEKLRKAGNETPGEAWAKVLAHCESGAWRHEALNDPGIDAVVGMLGGYQRIAHTPVDKLGFLEHRFAEHYADSRDVADVRHAVPQLTREDASKLADQRVGLKHRSSVLQSHGVQKEIASTDREQPG